MNSFSGSSYWFNDITFTKDHHHRTGRALNVLRKTILSHHGYIPSDLYLENAPHLMITFLIIYHVWLKFTSSITQNVFYGFYALYYIVWCLTIIFLGGNSWFPNDIWLNMISSDAFSVSKYSHGRVCAGLCAWMRLLSDRAPWENSVCTEYTLYECSWKNFEYGLTGTIRGLLVTNW